MWSVGLDEAIRKAGILVEALGWIRHFRGRYVVIKLGGSALEETDAVRRFLTDVIFLATVGMKPILVHGGGKSISQAMAAEGIEPKFVNGRRYTDSRTLEIVARVLAGEICGGLVQEIRRQGGDAVGLSYLTRNCLIGSKLTLKGSQGEAIDLGRVGEVVDIDRAAIEEATRGGAIPVIPSIALDAAGEKLNVNADTAAAAVARLLGAEKLVFLSDVPGIFRNRKRSLDVDFPSSGEPLSRLDCRRCHRRRNGSEGRSGSRSARVRSAKGTHRRRGDASFGSFGVLLRRGGRHRDRPLTVAAEMPAAHRSEVPQPPQGDDFANPRFCEEQKDETGRFDKQFRRHRAFRTFRDSQLQTLPGLSRAGRGIVCLGRGREPLSRPVSRLGLQYPGVFAASRSFGRFKLKSPN